MNPGHSADSWAWTTCRHINQFSSQTVIAHSLAANQNHKAQFMSIFKRMPTDGGDVTVVRR